MVALNSQWQAARHQRQSEVVERREQVAAILADWRHDRLAQADELHQVLAQAVADLQTETTLWLAQTTQQRQATIPPLRQTLHQYTQALQIETQALLDDYQLERAITTTRVRQQLATDHQAQQKAGYLLRQAIVAELHQIQQQVLDIQQQTAIDQAGYRQHQAMVRAELLPQLASYVAHLQAQVHITLHTLASTRQDLEATQQAQRQQERYELSQRVETLRAQLTNFRYQLQEQRAQLTTLVWGNQAAPPQPPSLPAKSPATPSPLRQPSPRVGKAPKPQPTQRSKVQGAAVAPIAPKAKTVTAASPSLPSPVDQSTPPLPPPPANLATAAPPIPALEEVVFNYLHLAQGARLSEIETELGINRFQAVDALRTLIEKDLIVKQDRTYLIQEEALL